jgi:hypothetical protein
LAAAYRLNELGKDSGERVSQIASNAPRGTSGRIFAALARAGIDVSQRREILGPEIRDWLSSHKEYEAALLADLSSLSDSDAKSNDDGSWSLTEVGDLLTATGYQEVGVDEFSRAFVYDSTRARRSWLDAMADAYGIEKSAVANQARYIQRGSQDEHAVSDDWFVASAEPLAKPSLPANLVAELTNDQQRTLLACLEADSDWIAWAAAAVVVNLTNPPWNSQELFHKEMSGWPRPRAALLYMVAILTAGDKRKLFLEQAAASDSADYRYAARMTISAASDLDSDGKIMEALCRDADLSVRPKDARKASPTPTHWTCADCRAVNAVDIEDCPACDEGVAPGI